MSVTFGTEIPSQG